MNIPVHRIERLTWVLIFGGLGLLGLGLATRPGDDALGWIIAAVGIAMLLIGVLLVWVRSRIKDGP